MQNTALVLFKGTSSVLVLSCSNVCGKRWRRSTEFLITTHVAARLIETKALIEFATISMLRNKGIAVNNYFTRDE